MRPRTYICNCRMCVMARWSSANRYRRKIGKPEYPKPDIPPRRGGSRLNVVPCPCRTCVNNRKRGCGPSDEELDRKALAKWDPEWGMRA